MEGTRRKGAARCALRASGSLFPARASYTRTARFVRPGRRAHSDNRLLVVRSEQGLVDKSPPGGQHHVSAGGPLQVEGPNRGRYGFGLGVLQVEGANHGRYGSGWACRRWRAPTMTVGWLPAGRPRGESSRGARSAGPWTLDPGRRLRVRLHYRGAALDPFPRLGYTQCLAVDGSFRAPARGSGRFAGVPGTRDRASVHVAPRRSRRRHPASWAGHDKSSE